MGSVGTTSKIDIVGSEKQINYAKDIIEGANSIGKRMLTPLEEKYERVKNRGTEKFTAEKNAKTLAKIQKNIDAVNAGLNFLHNTLTSGYDAGRIIDIRQRLQSENIFISESTGFVAGYTTETRTQQELFKELKELLKSKR